MSDWVTQVQKGILGDFDAQAKNHHLHKPMEKYLIDKFEKKVEAEKEAIKTKESSKVEEQKWVHEFSKISNLIREFKSQTFICVPCKRKFVSYEQWEIHTQLSQLHMNSIASMKKSSSSSVSSCSKTERKSSRIMCSIRSASISVMEKVKILSMAFLYLRQNRSNN